MTIDFWGLGLQAVNVLILVWLLSRLFWRPVAGAIAKRQDAIRTMLDEARAAQAKADAALAEVTETRAGIAAEREAVLAKATADADTATQAALAEAQDKAGKLIAAAKLASDRDADAARKKRAAQAAELSIDIAAKLLARMNTAAVQDAFLASLVEAIAQMPPKDRAALAEAEMNIDLVSATELDAAGREKVIQAVGRALGGSPEFNFVTDPEIVAGLALRTPHFALHNSWRSDLLKIAKELKNAA